ncbi:four-carbon acid sugar kinase family protein [Paracoccus sp. CPCC 101403]|uniref:Four-carbon acid sugar kinase family protein n=1 Tax=Paracoccus broussonetiae TaxID=3075834 RepID=A0ABU3EF37_9RHOB|nr:four-carbon acid sugar kinase family protein [Paracoccus sp. CPCC 101403]MDT1062045.1 four-carbon acid sugar kinase family protein [Paracoccus sp. CPCC 101403]
MTLPPGLLLGWLGDDFTGSAAVMEVLSFAGLPSLLFLDPPDAAQLAELSGIRAVGIATTARTWSPERMRQELPGAFTLLRETGAPLLHYKVCSTLDSAPGIGSIGAAAEIGTEGWASVLIAAPRMGRYQAFGSLFAEAMGQVHRLDRHPVMSRHPVTPMDEADVARHLARQTTRPTGCITLADDPEHALARLREAGVSLVTLDAVDDAGMARCGRLIWDHRAEAPFVIGSQGVEYALIEHWRSQGWLAPEVLPPSLGRDRLAVVSGSVSPVTAAQIAWAEANGFAAIPFDASTGGSDAEAKAVAQGLAALDRGADPLIYSAKGPDDPAVARFRARFGDDPTANEAVGTALGRILDQLIRRAGLRRAVISGGDTSGYAARALGVRALRALAPTIPGAAICAVQGGAHDGLQLALKGGQMGSEDYFGWVRDGGGPRRTA